MDWFVWICITAAAGGGCVTEKFWRAPTGRIECMDMLRSVRVEPTPAGIVVGEATSVETTMGAGGRVVAACVPGPVPAVSAPPAATKPATTK